MKVNKVKEFAKNNWWEIGILMITAAADVYICHRCTKSFERIENS